MATTNLYVSTTGSDSNAGTQAAPFKTILAASRAAQPGAIVHVAPGTYEGSFQTTASGTAAAPIQYISDVPGGAKIVPPANSSNEAGWDQRGDYVAIKGFEVDGTNYRSGTVWTIGISQAGSYSSVENSHVHNIMTNASQVAANGSHGGAGIMLEGYWGDTHINAIGNVVDHIGPSDHSASGAQYVQGIYADSGYDTIANNTIYAVSCDGISNYHDATNNTIVNNTIFNAGYGIDVWGGGTYKLSGTADNFFVANNIVYNSGTGIVEGGTMGTHNVFTNNLLNGNGTNLSLAHATAQNTVTSAPQFVNYVANGGGDYHLKSGSPGIDAGTANHAPATDMAGTPRPSGAGYDIGAYEYAAAAATPIPAPSPYNLPSGGAVNNWITGTGPGQTLTGTAKNDQMWGGHGVLNDTFVGGSGDDRYQLEGPASKVVEKAGEGIDTVHFQVLANGQSYTLADNVENLELAGTYKATAIGNGLDNHIAGNNADSTLNGGGGRDMLIAGTGANNLTGGSGNDMFVFDRAAAHNNVITDFKVGEDLIDLRAMMKSIGYAGSDPVAGGILKISQSGTDTVISVDTDGSGPAAAHNLVTLQKILPASFHVGSDLLWH
jgi:Ca2+-binding RTX toxin-like protein